jgi:hypothetical protein
MAGKSPLVECCFKGDDFPTKKKKINEIPWKAKYDGK